MYGFGNICFDAAAYHFFGPELSRAFAGIRAFTNCLTVSLTKIVIDNSFGLFLEGKHIMLAMLGLNIVLILLALYLMKRY
jgi:hypothetical protein